MPNTTIEKPKTTHTTAQTKLLSLISELSEYFVEREELIQLLFTGLISKHHAWIGGLPGTGKTALLNTISHHVSKTYKYQLFSATTTVDEVVGAVDPVKLLHEKLFERQLDNGIVKANIYFADENFKSNSPCLNETLGIMNEGTYNGQKADLEFYVGASNELPKDVMSNLNAYWDRLSLRYWIGNRVSRENRKSLMLRTSNGNQPEVSTYLTEAEIEELREQASKVVIPESIIDQILDLVDQLHQHGIDVSERKSNQLISILKAYAVVSGDEVVSQKHLAILKHVLWNQLKERDTVSNAVSDCKDHESRKVKDYALKLKEARLRYEAIPHHAIERRRRTLEQDLAKFIEWQDDLDSLSGKDAKSLYKQLSDTIMEMKAALSGLISF